MLPFHDGRVRGLEDPDNYIHCSRQLRYFSLNCSVKRRVMAGGRGVTTTSR